jgi:hypothetical protein
MGNCKGEIQGSFAALRMTATFSLVVSALKGETGLEGGDAFVDDQLVDVDVEGVA